MFGLTHSMVFSFGQNKSVPKPLNFLGLCDSNSHCDSGKRDDQIRFISNRTTPINIDNAPTALERKRIKRVRQIHRTEKAQ